jgi:hypothetical protein
VASTCPFALLNDTFNNLGYAARNKKWRDQINAGRSLLIKINVLFYIKFLIFVTFSFRTWSITHSVGCLLSGKRALYVRYWRVYTRTYHELCAVTSLRHVPMTPKMVLISPSSFGRPTSRHPLGQYQKGNYGRRPLHSYQTICPISLVSLHLLNYICNFQSFSDQN